MRSMETAFSAVEEPDPCVRWRAWRMWTEDGRPQGRWAEYLGRARELQLIDDSPTVEFGLARCRRPPH